MPQHRPEEPARGGVNAGRSEEEAAPEVVRKTRERTAGRAGVRWISDGSRTRSGLKRSTVIRCGRAGLAGPGRCEPAAWG